MKSPHTKMRPVRFPVYYAMTGLYKPMGRIFAPHFFSCVSYWGALVKLSDVNPDPPVAEFAGDVRRWARRRTLVLQAPTNKADPVKSADP
jgi:hypothetical protein